MRMCALALSVGMVLVGQLFAAPVYYDGDEVGFAVAIQGHEIIVAEDFTGWPTGGVLHDQIPHCTFIGGEPGQGLLITNEADDMTNPFYDPPGIQVGDTPSEFTLTFDQPVAFVGLRWVDAHWRYVIEATIFETGGAQFETDCQPPGEVEPRESEGYPFGNHAGRFWGAVESSNAIEQIRFFATTSPSDVWSFDNLLVGVLPETPPEVIDLSSDWNLVGYSDDDGQSVPLAECEIDDGAQIMSWQDAVTSGLVQGQVYYFESGLGYRVLAADDPRDDDSFRSTKGYWLLSYSGGPLTLLIPR